MSESRYFAYDPRNLIYPFTTKANCFCGLKHAMLRNPEAAKVAEIISCQQGCRKDLEMLKKLEEAPQNTKHFLP